MADQVKVAQRDALGDAFPILGEAYPNLIVLSPDVSPSTRATRFRDTFPERFICTGISEQNTISMAAGLSTSGWIPLVAGYAMFIAGKAWEPIRNSIAYPHLNVKIVATHAGINVGPDGVTHQATEDLALMRSIPGMTVLAPTDANQVLPVIRMAIEMDGPVYVRLERAPIANLTDPDAVYELGTSLTLREGNDATIIAVGGMNAVALEAAGQLVAEGIEVRVISMVAIKPLDESALIKAAQETGAIVTAEDHNKHGGLGGVVAEALVRSAPVPMEQVAIPDRFTESASSQELWTKFGLTPQALVDAVRRAISRKEAQV
jgi:transketolase